jgi:hypothetical protein
MGRSDPDRRRSDRAHRAGERSRSKPAQSRRRFASRELSFASANVERATLPGSPCGRACRRWSRGRLRCREDSRGTSTERMPSPDIDPNRTNLLDSDRRLSLYALLEVLVGKELDRLREDGAPTVCPALSLFRTRLPSTLRNVICISNRFNAKLHALH